MTSVSVAALRPEGEFTWSVICCAPRSGEQPPPYPCGGSPGWRYATDVTVALQPADGSSNPLGF